MKTPNLFNPEHKDPNPKTFHKTGISFIVSRGRTFLVRHYKASSVFLIATLMLFIELFTPLAPVERCIGFWVTHMPAFELSAFVGKKGAERFKNLNTLMKSYTQPNTIYDTNGIIITKAESTGSTPAFFKKYLISLENHRFNDTYVIDWSGVIRAAYTDISRGHFVEGASGIIQQFSRGIILQNDKKFWLRKGKEVLISYGLGYRYSHQRLLHYYMSSLFLGSFQTPAVQIRGVQQGAYELFGKDISEISKPEGLAIITLIGSPNTYLKNRPDFVARYIRLAKSLNGKKTISKADLITLINNIPSIDTSKVKKRALQVEYSDQIANQIRPFAPDSSVIHTTIDLQVTKAARNALTSAVKSFRKQTGVSDLDGFIVVAHYDSILAVVGSAQTGDNYMNNLDIRSAWRPGSLVKPLIYSEYISQGGNIYQKLPAMGPKTFEVPNGSAWTVKNYSPKDNYPGKQAAIKTLARSNNVAAAYLAVNYGDSLRNQLEKAGSDSTFSQYPATFIGADAPKPINLFRLLQTYVPPYGKIPNHFIMIKSDTSGYKSLFTPEVARETAYCLTFALDDPRGTLHFTERYYHWNDDEYLGKTGTAQKNTSAGLFITRPNGVSVLMGVFSRHGAPLKYASGGAIQGASLAPYMQRLFEESSIRNRIKGQFHFGHDEFKARTHYYVQKLKNVFKKVTSIGKLWKSLVGKN